MSHSPLPWGVEAHSAGFWIVSASGEVVADVSSADRTQTDKENAELIVMSVNPRPTIPVTVAMVDAAYEAFDELGTRRPSTGYVLDALERAMKARKT